MKSIPSSSAAAVSGDVELADRIARRDQAAFETLMRRHNGKLFRVARAIVRDDAEAEDVLQDAYLEAYKQIGEFRGEAQLSTWLTRIVINQALMRLRRQKRERVVVPFRSEDDRGPHRPRSSITRRSRPRMRPCARKHGACSSGASTNCRWRSERCS